MAGYKPVGRIRNQQELQKIKKGVLAQVSELNTMPVVMFNYIQSRIVSQENLKKELDKLVKVGQRIIKIKWSFKDSTFITTAFAHDGNGIIYDNVGTNIIFAITRPPDND